MIKVSIENKVAMVELNRPEALNALCDQLVTELGTALHKLDKDDNVHVILITGSEKAFAAGADIKEMVDKSFIDVYSEDFITAKWEEITKIRKPVIAAVSGYALGGGCEMAMMCDMILAGDNAKFSQPEITIGTIPGAGGTQRLPRFTSKGKAMELCLTGRMIDAAEAEKIGLVTRIFPAAELIAEAKKIAAQIASYSLPAVMMIKESINKAYETPLREGLMFERRLFHSSFATEDQKEGMKAFVEKRKANFKNR